MTSYGRCVANVALPVRPTDLGFSCEARSELPASEAAGPRPPGRLPRVAGPRTATSPVIGGGPRLLQALVRALLASTCSRGAAAQSARSSAYRIWFTRKPQRGHNASDLNFESHSDFAFTEKRRSRQRGQRNDAAQ